jgi:protein phosphatase
MTDDARESDERQSGGFQSMLARLSRMVQGRKAAASGGDTELLPVCEAQAAAEADSSTPEALEPSTAQHLAALRGDLTTASLGASQSPTAAPIESCPQCQAPRSESEPYCAGCGWIFPAPDAHPPASARTPAPQSPLLRDRYELGPKLSERCHITRFRGVDHAESDSVVVIVRGPIAESGQTTEADSPLPPGESLPPWPSIAWERRLLERTRHPALPRLKDSFDLGGFEYLIEELPVGQNLWDAWDDAEVAASARFLWIHDLTRALHDLHGCGAMLEGIRPEIVVITPEGQPRLTDLADLLPLPLPPDAPIRATFYSAPELVLAPENVDARADLYSVGATLYALHLGRELTDLDFELQGVPKNILARLPDLHPDFARIVSKTFCRDPGARFPTEDAVKDDPTGFLELMRELDACGRSMDLVRLDIAAWSTTGMVRSGNEDAFALFRTARWRENQLSDSALILLADGMGGYEAGEVAAALAIKTLSNFLLGNERFDEFAPPSQPGSGDSSSTASVDHLNVQHCKELLTTALREANQHVYSAAANEERRRGMGCTAEVVYVDGRTVVVGHIGDSRTYRLSRGSLTQLTRDQTWVNGMVDLGRLTPEQAVGHPRSSELQQAIGAQPDIQPAVYSAPLQPGDWLLVCSDGITNHVSESELKDLLQICVSAESAARRLINLANLRGGTDNATVVLVRAV